MQSFKKSEDWIVRAKNSEALIGERPSLFLTGYEPVKGAPKFIQSAQGCRLTDVDGNNFVDLIMGYGSVILGHANPIVQESVYTALTNGANPTLLSEVHVILAEKIQAIVPNAERVTFLKTGSDAVSAAVRLARVITGRKYILKCGMHGWHDWCCFESPGVLQETKNYTIGFNYGDIEHLRDLLNLHKNDVACIVMMPYSDELPKLDYLQEVRRLCTQYDVLFVLDEVRSGFRVALGGAQQYFKVDADLVAFSKAMANGYPISALAGKASYMSHILDLNLTFTFYRDPIPMSAALATINELERGSALKKLVDIGKTLKSHIHCSANKNSIPTVLTGHEATPTLKFGFSEEKTNKHAMRAFCSSMIGEGVLVHPLHHWFLSSSIDDDDLSKILEATDVSLSKVAKLCD